MDQNGKLSKTVTGAFCLYMLWLVMTFPFSREEMIIGAVAAVIVAVIFRSGFEVLQFRKFGLYTFYHAFVYVPYLLYQIVKANIDVAKIVLSWKIEINPAIVKCRINLKSDFARTILANSITLTPGTLTVDIIDEYIYIHCIKIDNREEKSVYENIVKGFEERIERFAL